MTKTAETATEYISIGEAAERTGLTQRTLRYYEEFGLLRPPARVARGQRLYGPDDLARIAWVRRMKELLGFSLHDIKLVLEAEEAKRFLRAERSPQRVPAKTLKQLRSAEEVTARQLGVVETRIGQMQAMRKELARDLAGFRERIEEIERVMGEKATA